MNSFFLLFLLIVMLALVLFKLHVLLLRCVGNEWGLEALFSDFYIPKAGSEELANLVSEGQSTVNLALRARKREAARGPKYAPPAAPRPPGVGGSERGDDENPFLNARRSPAKSSNAPQFKEIALPASLR